MSALVPACRVVRASAAPEAKHQGGSPRGAPDVSILPDVPAPAPLETPHFPSRLHAHVWRNWSLVPVDRLAEAVGAPPRDLLRVARAMGLHPQPRWSRGRSRRIALTVIRRNWHLLPYDQLLTLLDWTPEQLAFALREDDFLWIKLGGLKPHCEPIRWSGTAPGAPAAVELVRRVVRGQFPGHADKEIEPLLTFVEHLSARPSSSHSPTTQQPSSGFRGLRFCYSYFALYGDPLLEPDLDPYPDGYLARLASEGVTGVWLQGVLYQLATFPWRPELSRGHEERLRNLRALVERAARHGIRVFLYLNEPRAQPLGFFATHPDLKGVTEGDHATLCTTVPEVRDFLSAAVAEVCRTVPGLGGFFTISASENLTHCWSHGGGARCARCGPRGAAVVVAEVNAAIHAGIRAAGHGQGLIVWDWGWNDAWAAEVIRRLPKDVALMSVSEWNLPLSRGGVKVTVGEYSLSAIGPGPRARRHWSLARERGLATLAKIQANNTWELSAVPYLPVLGNVAEHVSRLRDLDLDGIMLGWTLGGFPSPNLEVVAAVMKGETLEDVARRRFGPDLAAPVMDAWEANSAAFREFPFSGQVVYSAPIQLGPANLLWPEPTGYRSSMVGFPYDDLDGWRGPYPAEVFVGQLRKVGGGFRAAALRLEQRLRSQAHADRHHRAAAQAEADLGHVAAIHFLSVAQQAEFVQKRNAYRVAIGREERLGLLDTLASLVEAELELARELHRRQVRDSRIGFEASNQYFYVPLDLAEKVLNCRWLLDIWLPGEREKAETA